MTDGSATAEPGTVYLVSTSGILASADFDTGAGDWQVHLARESMRNLRDPRRARQLHTRRRGSRVQAFRLETPPERELSPSASSRLRPGVAAILGLRESYDPEEARRGWLGDMSSHGEQKGSSASLSAC